MHTHIIILNLNFPIALMTNINCVTEVVFFFVEIGKFPAQWVIYPFIEVRGEIITPKPGFMVKKSQENCSQDREKSQARRSLSMILVQTCGIQGTTRTIGELITDQLDPLQIFRQSKAPKTKISNDIRFLEVTSPCVLVGVFNKELRRINQRMRETELRVNQLPRPTDYGIIDGHSHLTHLSHELEIQYLLPPSSHRLSSNHLNHQCSHKTNKCSVKFLSQSLHNVLMDVSTWASHYFSICLPLVLTPRIHKPLTLFSPVHKTQDKDEISDSFSTFVGKRQNEDQAFHMERTGEISSPSMDCLNSEQQQQLSYLIRERIWWLCSHYGQFSELEVYLEGWPQCGLNTSLRTRTHFVQRVLNFSSKHIKELPSGTSINQWQDMGTWMNVSGLLHLKKN